MFREFPATRIMAALDKDDLLPAILFRTSRKQCDDDITRLATSRIGKLRSVQKKDLVAEIRSIMAKYDMEESAIKEHPQYGALIATGTGAHHAGQLLMWRLLLEELMTRNKLRMMIATGTVAAGVDFPARTVIITAHSKRGAEGFNVLSSSEFQQMSGRAGRRGKDTVGICLIAPGQFSDARVLHKVASKEAEPLRSAYFAAPASVLNLLKFRNVDDLRYTVSKSLASFIDRKDAAKIRAEAEEISLKAESDESLTNEARKKARKRANRKSKEADVLEKQQETQLNLSLEGLEALGYLDAQGLSEKGYWAAQLCTSLVLQLGEAIEEGLFYELSEMELAALVASIAGDSHRVYFSLAANPIKKEYYEQLQVVVERVATSYKGPTTTADAKVNPDAALTVIAWMEANDWSSYASLLRLAGVAEGDATRVISQAADHLHQISRLMESHPELARTAWEARKKLLKPPLSDALVV